MLITFSGLDGAGKTTLIASLKTALEEQNYQVTALTIYGQCSLYGIMRRVRDRIIGAVEKAFPEKLEKYEISSGVNFSKDETQRYGPFQKLAVNILRKNWVKRCVFVLDLFILLVFRLYLEKVKKHIFILDRYFYDFLADVADGHGWMYIRTFLLFAPKPDVPIYVDVSPDKAFSRRGEYSIGQLERRRKIYMKIFRWVRNPLFIPNDDLEQTKKRIEGIVLDHLTKDKTTRINNTAK